MQINSASNSANPLWPDFNKTGGFLPTQNLISGAKPNSITVNITSLDIEK